MQETTSPVKNRYARWMIGWLEQQPQERWYCVASRLIPVREEGAYEVLQWMVSQPECERAIACTILWTQRTELDRLTADYLAGLPRSRSHRHLWQIIDRAREGGFASSELGWLNGWAVIDGENFHPIPGGTASQQLSRIEFELGHRPSLIGELRAYRRSMSTDPDRTLVLPDCLTMPFGGAKLPDVTYKQAYLSDAEWQAIAPSMIGLGARASAFTVKMSLIRRFAYGYLGWRSIGGRVGVAIIVLFPVFIVGLAVLRDWYSGRL